MCGIAGIYSDFINNLNSDYIAKMYVIHLYKEGQIFKNMKLSILSCCFVIPDYLF